MVAIITELYSKNKYFSREISKTMIVIAGLILCFTVLFSQQAWANTNKINIENRQQEISLKPLGNNAYQGNMEISWNSEANPGNKDVKFSINNLKLEEEGDSGSSQFGFTRLQNNQSEIEAGAVLLEIDGDKVGSLDQEQKVLKTEDRANNLKFKIDNDKINWSELPPGVYKGDINIHPDDIDLIPPAGSQHGRPKLIVEVGAVPKLVLDANEINWAIAEPAREADQYSEAISWQVDNISADDSINVQFSSQGGEKEGYRDLTDSDYKDFFEYVIYQGDYEKSGSKYTFSPRGERQVPILEGEIRLKYIGQIAEVSWPELKAGNYHDVVNITISAD